MTTPAIHFEGDLKASKLAKIERHSDGSFTLIDFYRGIKKRFDSYQESLEDDDFGEFSDYLRN